MVKRVVAWLVAFAGAAHRLVLAALRLVQTTSVVRLLVIVWRLWPRLWVPALLVAGLVFLCGWTAAGTGRGALAALIAWQAPVVLAWICAVLLGLLVLEAFAMGALALIQIGLRFAYDTERDTVGMVLLLVVAALALLSWSDLSQATRGPYVIWGVPVLVVATAAMGVAAIWFGRVYRRPRHPAFRPFWSDVVSARHYLQRTSHDDRAA